MSKLKIMVNFDFLKWFYDWVEKKKEERDDQGELRENRWTNQGIPRKEEQEVEHIQASSQQGRGEGDQRRSAHPEAVGLTRKIQIMNTKMKMLKFILKEMAEKSEDSHLLGLVDKGKEVLGQLIEEGEEPEPKKAEKKQQKKAEEAAESEDEDSIRTEDAEEEEESDQESDEEDPKKESDKIKEEAQ